MRVTRGQLRRIIRETMEEMAPMPPMGQGMAPLEGPMGAPAAGSSDMSGDEMTFRAAHDALLAASERLESLLSMGLGYSAASGRLSPEEGQQMNTLLAECENFISLYSEYQRAE